MPVGCDPCDAAGDLFGGTPLTTPAKVKLVQEAVELHPEFLKDTAALISYLHKQCKFGRSCVCQHGRNWEQDPDDPTVPAYLDALPPDDPRRKEYEAHVGRRIGEH